MTPPIISSNADLLSAIEKYDFWDWNWCTPEYKWKYEKMKKNNPFKELVASKLVKEKLVCTVRQFKLTYDWVPTVGEKLIVFPDLVVEQLDLKEGDELEITTRGHVITLKKVKEKK